MEQLKTWSAEHPFVAVALALFFLLLARQTLFGKGETARMRNIIVSASDRPEAAEFIVIGGGVTGCTAALALAKRGRKVLLFERDMSLQDRIVGELLQPGGIRALERLGLSDCAKEDIDAVEVRGYIIYNPAAKPGELGEKVLTYPSSDPSGEAEYFGILNRGKHTDSSPLGRSFHHGRFVDNLRKKVLQHPSIEVIEGTVSKLIEENGRVVGVEYKKREVGSLGVNPDDPVGVESKLKSGGGAALSRRAQVTLIADGIWSTFRKTCSTASPNSVGSFVGLVIDHPPMKAPVPHPLHGHVILADPTPCLIYQISSAETRLLVDIQGKLPSISNGDMNKYMIEKVCPQLPEMFRPFFLEALKVKEIKSMPCKYFPAEPCLKQGAFLIGDSLNMRNPLTGGGMTVCIRDAELFGNIFGIDPSDNTAVDLADVESLQEGYLLFLSERKQYASTINTLANALHEVFSNTEADETRDIIRSACFEYLSLGGPYAAGPIGLLAGLTPKPSILVLHFFMVGFYGVFKVFSDSRKKGGFLNRVFQMYCVLRVAYNIIVPLLVGEKTTFLSWTIAQVFGGFCFPPFRKD